MTELRSAFRSLRAEPATTAVAILVLTLAIAAATVTFSVVDTIALRSMPFEEPGRLLTISRVSAANPRPGVVAPQDFFSWQEGVDAFEALAASGSWALQLQTPAGEMERLTALRTTANLFDVLRVRPALGRTFGVDHEQTGHDKVVVLSHGLWVRRFNADPAIVGRTIAFGKDTREVIGVMPEGFTYPIGPPRPTDAWIPHVARPKDRDHASPGRGYYLQVVGRLRPGATLEQAQAQVERVTAQAAAAYPSSFWEDVRPVVMPLHDLVVGPAGQWLKLVLGAVALVLVIAYVNVANLLLARATARGRELATRAALGASRGHLARMLLVEALLLTTVASAAGLALSYWGLSIVTAALPDGLARASAIALDARVLTVAIAAAIGTGLLFGLVPAWHAMRSDLAGVMKDGSTGVIGGRGRVRWMRLLLGGEVAFVVAVLVAVALFVTSFIRIVRADLGFDRDRVVGFSVNRSFEAVPDEQRAAAADVFAGDLIARARAVPGVADAAIVNGNLPLAGGSTRYSIEVEGYDTTGGDMLELRRVTPGYVETMGMRLLEGRSFEPGDRQGAPLVALINEEAARRFFKGGAVGRTFEFRGRTTVIGVVANSRYQGPEIDVRPELYLPLTQIHSLNSSDISAYLVVRTQEPPDAILPALRTAIQEVTGAASAQPPVLLDAEFRKLTATRRFNAGIMAVFGAVALVIGAIGIYGVMAFTVAQQARAIGLRRALGASRGRVLRGVMGDAAGTLAGGIAAGLFAAWLLSGVFASVVFGVAPTEVWLYTMVALISAAAGVLAALVPAARAARVDPIVVLRQA